jgi:hypothetical protein
MASSSGEVPEAAEIFMGGLKYFPHVPILVKTHLQRQITDERDKRN